MDSLASISIGLALRLLVDVVSNHSSKLGGTIVGIWEGISMHHLVSKSPSSLDPYAAYCLRALIDFSLSRDLSKMFLVLLWTIVSGLMTEAAGPLLLDRDQDDLRVRDSVRTLPDSRRATPKPRILITPSSPYPVPIRIIAPPVAPTSFPVSHSADKPSVSSSETESENSVELAPLPTPPITPSYDINFARPDEPVEPDNIEYINNPDMLQGDEYQLRPPDYITSEKVHSEPSSDSTGSPLPIPEPPAVPVILAKGVIPESSQVIEGQNVDTDDESLTPHAHPTELPLSPTVLHLPPPSLFPFNTSLQSLTIPVGMPEPGIPSALSPNLLTFAPSVPLQNFSKPADGNDADDEDAEADPPGDEDNLSFADSLMTQEEVESIISAVGQKSLLSKAELIRQQAKAEEIVHDRLESKRQKALKNGNTREAFLLSLDVRDAEERANKLHEKAARRYFHAHNQLKSHPPRTIDVHGLRKQEALRKTEIALRDALIKNDKILRVIVGKGIHSIGQAPKLRPFLIQEMTGQNISVTIDSTNAGVLLIVPPP